MLDRINLRASIVAVVIVGFCPTPALSSAPAMKGKPLTKPQDAVKAKGASPAGKVATPPSSGKAIKDSYIDLGPYMVRLQQKIQPNWHPPKDPKTVVVKWTVLPDGVITALRIDKSSGDPDNDKAALDSVAKSAPFEPLPPGVDAMPIQYQFQQAIRSGMEQIPLSERAASVSLSNSAIELVNKKNLDEAIDKLDFAFERDPKNGHISQVLRYVSAYVNDDTPDKIHVLHRVLALDPEQHAAIEKLRILHRAAGVDPNSASERMALGTDYLKKKNPEGALVEFTAANSIKAGTCPQDTMVEAYRVLAGHRMARKWQTVLKYHKDVECLCGLGRSYQLAGDYAEAEKYYKEATALDPQSAMPKNLLARLEEEKTSGVKEKIDTRMVDHITGNSGKSDLVPRAQILNNEGIQCFDDGDYSAAIAKFKEALTIDPLRVEVKKNLSGAYNNMGIKAPPEECAGFYRKALFVNPENPNAHQNLSSWLKHEGKSPDSAEVRSKLADEFAGSGDYVSAVAELRESIALKSDAGAQSRLKNFLSKAPAIP